MTSNSHKRSLEAMCATSQYRKRQQILFDSRTGLILDVGDLGIPRSQLDFYFHDDCLLFAGMGDVHIHAREDISGLNNYKEDFLSARKALHQGGLCHAGDMPNNPIPPIDDESYQKKMELALKAKGEIWIYAGIGPETRPLTLPVPYKVYMGPSVGDLFFRDLTSLDQVLRFYEGQVVSFHCEDPVILEHSKHESSHFLRRPVRAEVVATKDALNFIEKYHLKAKLCHFSSGEGLDLVRSARAKGVEVSLEVTPQHLYFDDETLKDKDYFQMNPPIRSAHDREKLMEALKNGEFDFLATDHAPHTLEEKRKGISGLTGLDTYGSFVTWLIDEGVSPHIIAKMTTENPGRFFNQFLPTWKKMFPLYEGFGKGHGFLEKGYCAHFTVLNLKKPIKISMDFLKTKVSHSPFLGIQFPGSLECLFIRGQVIHDRREY